MEFNDLTALIKSRRSIRRWQDKEISPKMLTDAIEIACWAPNGGNRQNWRFYVIVDRKTIKSIADKVQSTTDLMASWPEAVEFTREVTKWRENASFFRNAPAAIAVAAAQYSSIADRILKARGENDPQALQIRTRRETANTRIQSVASAIAYLVLVLHNMGLGAVWMTGPVQAAGEIEKILGIPTDMNLVAFIPVGYPAESPEPKQRRPVEEICQIVG